MLIVPRCLYTTRAGKKAFVMAIACPPSWFTGQEPLASELSYPVLITIEGERGTYCVDLDGLYCPGEECLVDLVSYWTGDQ